VEQAGVAAAAVSEALATDYDGLLRVAPAWPGNWTGGGSLRAHANGMYVTADNAGASPLIANRTAIGPWEEFDMVDEGNGTIALFAHADSRYVTADNAGASPLIANRTAVGPWEEFDLIHD
jgi:hypothetical protein